MKQREYLFGNHNVFVCGTLLILKCSKCMKEAGILKLTYDAGQDKIVYSRVKCWNKYVRGGVRKPVLAANMAYELPLEAGVYKLIFDAPKRFRVYDNFTGQYRYKNFTSQGNMFPTTAARYIACVGNSLEVISACEAHTRVTGKKSEYATDEQYALFLENKKKWDEKFVQRFIGANI